MRLKSAHFKYNSLCNFAIPRLGVIYWFDHEIRGWAS